EIVCLNALIASSIFHEGLIAYAPQKTAGRVAWDDIRVNIIGELMITRSLTVLREMETTVNFTIHAIIFAADRIGYAGNGKQIPFIGTVQEYITCNFLLLTFRSKGIN